MNPAGKLFNEKLSYAVLMNEYKHLSIQQLKEIKLSFCDWLIDDSCNGLSSSHAHEFKLSLYFVIKQKLEIFLTAFGSIKLDEIPQRLFRSKDFVSVRILQEIFASEKGFEIVNRSGEQYVQLSSSISSRTSSPSISTNTNLSTQYTTNLIDLTPGPICNVASAQSETENIKNASIKKNSNSSEDMEDAKAQQLRFLFQCQPDVISALHPSVTLNNLFKAYSFWKSYCMLGRTSFIAWMFSLFKFKSKNNFNGSLLYSNYTAAVKKLLAQEALHYVTNKPRTIVELTTLVSKAKVGFADNNIMLEAIKENNDILLVNTTSLYPFSSPLVYSVNSWNKLKFNKVSEVLEIATPQPIAASSRQMSSSPVKLEVADQKQLTVDHTHLKVIDSTFELQNYLKDLYVTDDVRAKIIPLLTVKVSLETLRFTILKLLREHNDFVQEMAEQFDSFIDFLIEFAEKFKPSLPLKSFELHLMKLVSNEVDVIVAAEQPLSIDDLVQKFTQENLISLFSKNFLLDMFQINSKKLTVETDLICQTETPGVASKKIHDFEDSSDKTIMKEFKNLSNLHSLLSSAFRFFDFKFAFQNLPKHLKVYCKKFSNSFYAFLINALNCEKYNNNLRLMICTEIVQLLEDKNVKSIDITVFPKTLSFENDFLINWLDVKDAIINCSPSSSLILTENHVHFKDEITNNSAHSSNFGYEKHNSSSLEELKYQINAILNGSNFAKEKLGMLFHCLKHMPESVCSYLKQIKLSPFGFILETVPSDHKFIRILTGELLKYIQDATLFCDEFLKGFFRYVPQFMTINEFVDFLSNCKESFVVLCHFQIGNIVSSVRYSAENGQVIFFNKNEEETLFTVKKMLMSKTNASFNELFELFWNCKQFTIKQRDFLFGVSTDFWPLEFHKVHLKRYLLMYPSEFTVDKQSIYFKFSQKQVPVVQTQNSITIVLSSTSGEDGEVFSSDEQSKKPCKRVRIEKKQTTSDSSTISIQSKRKHKRKRRKHKTRTASTKKVSDTAVLKELVNSLPDYLIQDVIVGRLMASDSQTMKFPDLLGLLATSLLRERKQLVLSHETAGNLFKEKTMNVIKQGTQFQLKNDNENPDNDENALVCLVSQTNNVSKPVVSQPVVVFKWIHRLTGISKKRISCYVTKILDVNRKPLSLSIIFTMISQKYGMQKTLSETPNDVLHSQTVACIKSDSKFFINIVKKTCGFTNWINVNEKNELLQEFSIKIPDDDIVEYLTSYLQHTGSQNGSSIDELAEQVASKFQDELQLLTIGSVRIIVQGLIAANSKFGFTPLGKIVYQPNDMRPNFSDESLDESSDDCLTMDISDISDNENQPVPDSTNNKEIMMEDEFSNKTRDSHSDTNQCSNDIIRCSYEAPILDEVVAADSTTSDIPQPSSPPKDPRIQGKAFQNKIYDESPKTQSEEISSQMTINRSNSNFEEMLNQAHFTDKRLNQYERNLLIENFAISFLTKNGNSCETDVFVKSAYENFKSQRFARSVLAFEAYIINFFATSRENSFGFGNPQGGLGASYVFYHPPQANLQSLSNPRLPLEEQLPTVLDIVYSYIISKPQKNAPLQAVCKKVINFLSKTHDLDHREITCISRNLILVACIRNLKWFFFAKVDSVIFIRQESVDLPSRSISSDGKKLKVSCSKYSSFHTVKQCSKDEMTIAAVQKMAEILRKYGPCKKSTLRELWLVDSHVHHRKVFGTGVSFSLSLRKYEIVFPTTNDGLIYLDETSLSKFLEKGV